MCYIIITSGNVVWFLLSLIDAMLIAWATVRPNWLIGPRAIEDRPIANSSFVVTQYPSVGIYTRCKKMASGGFHCGPFDLDGFATDSSVYPTEWKAAMFFISLALTILILTVLMTLVTCCRQSAFGKSIHNMTACAQVAAAISVMLTIFLHALGWGARRVQALCGSDAEPFYTANCSIGNSLYAAALAVPLALLCAGISRLAESSNLKPIVRKRVEEGDRLVCIL